MTRKGTCVTAWPLEVKVNFFPNGGWPGIALGNGKFQKAFLIVKRLFLSPILVPFELLPGL